MELQKIYTDLILEFTPSKVGSNRVVMVEGDNNSRCLAITFKHDNEIYPLDENYEYRMNVKYGSDSTYFSSADNDIFYIDDGRLIINIPSSVMKKRGLMYANISITLDDSQLTSEIFCLSVMSSIKAIEHLLPDDGDEMRTISWNDIKDKPKINGRVLDMPGNENQAVIQT